MPIIKRKGSKSTKDIPVVILKQLNEGLIETANLVEWLAVDQRLLLENLLASLNRTIYLEPILARINALKKQTVNTINETIGTSLYELAQQHDDAVLVKELSHHTSDLVRCWATYFIGRDTSLSIEEKLEKIQLFAADTHFGVREICWMAVRPSITKQLLESITILTLWTQHENENIRRFATEATRPRGVWCEHIEELKQNPALGLSLLESLRSDKAKYVQNSVANWLNDASKTQPQFVQELCNRWNCESDTKETDYIVKRALRTVEK